MGGGSGGWLRRASKVRAWRRQPWRCHRVVQASFRNRARVRGFVQSLDSQYKGRKSGTGSTGLRGGQEKSSWWAHGSGMWHGVWAPFEGEVMLLYKK